MARNCSAAAFTNRFFDPDRGVFARRTPQCLSSLPQVSGAREHGDPDTFAPEVSQALQKLYPDDAATGFAIGDLRGAFRVEFMR
jgi:hypothetical protein